MNFDDYLRRYRNGAFTDDDVTRCTGLSTRAWRELIKMRAVRTITADRGRGHVRLCDATVLKRAAVIAALNQAGFSLPVSGRIAYFLPYHTLLYAVCDPCKILLHDSAEAEPTTGLPPRVEHPIADWFDPDKPAQADPDVDWLIEIYDRRFAGVVSPPKEPTIFGDLRNEGTSFVAWFPLRRQDQRMGSAIEKLATELLPHRFADFVADWEDPRKWRKELRLLDYKLEKHDRHDDPLCIAAEASACSPIIRTTINLTLAIRKALRRYLGIEPPMLRF
jgi:hypothetical protein